MNYYKSKEHSIICFLQFDFEPKSMSWKWIKEKTHENKNFGFTKKIKIPRFLRSNLGSTTEESQNHQVNIDNHVKVTIIIKNNKMLYRYKLPMRIQTERNKRKRIQEELI
jgi:hypothetical protein